jgi:hypothetical protein
MALTDSPTAPQLKLLRTLADRTGQSFAWPSTRGAASREIKRLTGTPRSSRYERAEDRQAVAAAPRGGAAAIRDSEIVGYGGDAHWRGQQG